MKRMSLSVIVGLLLIAFSSQAMAHTLWINLYESFAHPPGHAIASIGWGHVVPMDDLLVSEFGSIQLASYELIGPDLKSTALPLLDLKMPEKIKTSSDLTAQTGDLGIRKFGLTDKTRPAPTRLLLCPKTIFSPCTWTKRENKNGSARPWMKSRALKRS